MRAASLTARLSGVGGFKRAVPDALRDEPGGDAPSHKCLGHDATIAIHG